MVTFCDACRQNIDAQSIECMISMDGPGQEKLLPVLDAFLAEDFDAEMSDTEAVFFSMDLCAACTRIDPRLILAGLAGWKMGRRQTFDYNGKSEGDRPLGVVCGRLFAVV